MPSADGSTRSALDLAVADHPHRRRRRGGELVEAVVPAEDQRPGAARRPAPGQHRRHPGVGAADRGGHRPGRVGQRAEEVEDRGDAHLAPRARRRAAARVEDRREEEADAGLLARSGRPPAAGRSMTTPSASSTSAAPEDDDAARLPCLATGTPAAAVTTAAIVEMLTVCAPSPPVPTMSTQASGQLHRRRLREHRRRPGRRPRRRDSPLARSATANAGDLRGRRLPGHDLAHRPGGVGRGEVLRAPAAG